MSLLGIDVGTTGCKAAAFSEDGRILALHYEEHQIHKPKPGWAELDPQEVWDKVKIAIKNV
jgi:xylulokinase